MEVVEQSPLLVRAASVISLNSSETDMLLEEVIERIDDFHFIARVGIPYTSKQSFFSQIASTPRSTNAQVNKFYGEILCTDSYFRAASIRQIGLHSYQILMGTNIAIV